jgi:hypothetical protein
MESQAFRESEMADVESGTQEVSRHALAGEIEAACNQIDLALASALVCLSFLGENTTGVSHVAVSDAEAALQRVDAVVETLRRALQRTAAASGSGTGTG